MTAISEIASRLNVHRSTVTDWRKQGCPTTSMKAVRKWLNARENAKDPQPATFLEIQRAGRFSPAAVFMADGWLGHPCPYCDVLDDRGAITKREDRLGCVVRVVHWTRIIAFEPGARMGVTTVKVAARCGLCGHAVVRGAAACVPRENRKLIPACRNAAPVIA